MDNIIPIISALLSVASFAAVCITIGRYYGDFKRLNTYVHDLRNWQNIAQVQLVKFEIYSENIAKMDARIQAIMSVQQQMLIELGRIGVMVNKIEEVK